MSTVRLDALVSAIAADAGLDPDRVTQHKTEIKRWINETRREIYELPVRMQALEFRGEIATVANVTAGTVAATQNQSEVTGSSTAFVTAMTGRYISINSSPWQRISFVTDSTHLSLEASWNGDSGTGLSYTIWKRDYALPPKAAKVDKIVAMSEPDTPLAYYDPGEFHARYGLGDSFGDPLAWTQYGSSEFPEAYLGSTVYTVTSTANSPLVDFAAGSGLVTGVAAGDRLTILSTAFTVEKVLSDVKLAVRGFISVSTAATSATALSSNRLLIQFYQAANAQKVYMFDGKRTFADLYADGDLLEPGWYMAVKKGAVAKAMSFVASPREPLKIQDYQSEILQLIRSQYKAFNPAPRLKLAVPGRYTGLMGVFPSKRDEGY